MAFRPNLRRKDSIDSETTHNTPELSVVPSDDHQIPNYLNDTYHWAYIHPKHVALLDNDFVVWSILWGNSGKLMRAAFEEVKPGSHVLQAANVYGTFVTEFARHIGPEGKFEVTDILPIQVKNCKRRLSAFPYASVRLMDAEIVNGGPYDVACSYFLLHEVPHEKSKRIVDSLLKRVAPGGKALFVDYHKPHRFHPLNPIMYPVWHLLEPYAIDLIATEIKDLASEELRDQFEWKKETYFGGLYQRVVATKRA